VHHASAPPSRAPKVGIVLVVLVVAVTAVLVVRRPGHEVTGRAEAAAVSVPTGGASGGLPREQPGWTTLSNPAAGLSYQIPPGAGWTTAPAPGQLGDLNLGQGARLSAYNCGNPANTYYRGLVGSASAPRTDPATLATALAQQAGAAYYTSVAKAVPNVTLSRASQVKLVIGKTTVTGALVTALSRQGSDSCLASAGETAVLVLSLSQTDGILVVNGDLAGGPASPAPATTTELNQILATAEPLTS
jgi:hypothetical protein